METVLSQSTPCPHCVVTDHGSRRGRASRTVRPAREVRRNVAIQCHIVPPSASRGWGFVDEESPGIAPNRSDHPVSLRQSHNICTLMNGAHLPRAGSTRADAEPAPCLVTHRSHRQFSSFQESTTVGCSHRERLPRTQENPHVLPTAMAPCFGRSASHPCVQFWNPSRNGPCWRRHRSCSRSRSKATFRCPCRRVRRPIPETWPPGRRRSQGRLSHPTSSAQRTASITSRSGRSRGTARARPSRSSMLMTIRPSSTVPIQVPTPATWPYSINRSACPTRPVHQVQPAWPDHEPAGDRPVGQQWQRGLGDGGIARYRIGACHGPWGQH